MRFLVESFLDDVDFRAKVTREEFEELCHDLFDRLDNVVTEALDTAQMGMVGSSIVLKSMIIISNVLW